MRDWGRDCWCESGVDNSCGKRFSQQFGSLPMGYDHKYVYTHFGYNLRATDLQAAIGLAQLDKLPRFIQQRAQNFTRLHDSLKDLTQFFTLPRKTPHSEPSWFGFWLTVDEHADFTRTELAEYLEKHNIQTRNLFAGNLVRQPVFESLEEGKDYRIAGSLEITDKAMNNTFWVGVYPGMQQEQLSYISSCIREFVSK
jgi:CDP-6-deoxy-D-xylo-4-hexulose-3-dehydrase